MQGFLTFIREQGVMGLAIGFLLGGAVSGLVTSLVEDIISPLLGIFMTRLESMTELEVQIASATVMIGSFLAELIDFALIAAVIYFVFKGLRLDTVDMKKK
ncbi:MAG: MscL family protein [Patescibacteria group bacterium]